MPPPLIHSPFSKPNQGMTSGMSCCTRGGSWDERLASACVGVMMLLLAAPGAGAADAEELMRRGIDLRRNDKDGEALILFQQAYDLSQRPKALAQIGFAEQALGKWGAADRHLRQASQSADDPWVIKHRKAIDDALRLIGPHVGRLEVRGNPAGAQVLVDGEVIGTLPLGAPITVTAGGVAIEVRTPGCLPIVRASTVPPGMLIRESFDLQPFSPATAGVTAPGPLAARVTERGSLAQRKPVENPLAATDDRTETVKSSSQAPAAATTEPPSGGSARSYVVIGAAGLAVAAVAFGVIEHLSWQNKASQFRNTTGCDPAAAHRGSPTCENLYQDGQRAEYVAFGAYGLGVGLAATAAILYFTAPTVGADSHQVACGVNPFGARFGCAMRF